MQDPFKSMGSAKPRGGASAEEEREVSMCPHRYELGEVVGGEETVGILYTFQLYPNSPHLAEFDYVSFEECMLCNSVWDARRIYRPSLYSRFSKLGTGI